MKKLTEYVNEFKATALASINVMEAAKRELSEWLMKALPAQLKIELHLATTQEELDELDATIQELIEELDYMEMGKFLIANFSEKTLKDLIDDVGNIVQNLHDEISSMKPELDSISADTLFWAIYKPTCSNCGATVDPSDNYCHTCNNRLSPIKEYKAPETIECVKCGCGRTYDKNWAFCPSCGKANADREQPKLTPLIAHYKDELAKCKDGQSEKTDDFGL